MKRTSKLLVTALLGAGAAIGIGYGVLHAGHRPTGPDAGLMPEVLVTAPRADRVVEEIVVTADGPTLVLPVVEVEALRGPRQLAGQPLLDGVRVN